MTQTFTGTCFCGAIQLELTGAPEEMGYCHCQSCRSYSGERVSTFILYKAENVRVVSGENYLGRFMKTAMSERQFCKRCGGHLMTHHPTLGLTDVRPCVVPDVIFKPMLHLNYAEAVQQIKDGLPKLRDFPLAVGGSGETMCE